MKKLFTDTLNEILNGKSFKVLRAEQDIIEICIDYAPQKALIKMFTFVVATIVLLTLLFSSINSWIKVYILIIGIISMIISMKLTLRPFIILIKRPDGSLTIKKQGSLFSQTDTIHSEQHPEIIAKKCVWIGNRRYSTNSNLSEPIIIFSDGNYKQEISLVSPTYFSGNLNINGVLKKNEVEEIAKQLNVPFSIQLHS